jgi:ubiquinone/menaquinone biosynthesis C-methylase UbiE
MWRYTLIGITFFPLIPIKQTPAQPNQVSMFADAVAYNRFMGGWSRLVAPLLIEFAQIRDGERVLEVGSGTGSLSLTIAASLPRCRVVGIDRSAQYVSYARSQIAGSNVRFESGDARELPFPAAEFDASTSLLVLNFIPDVRKAMAEMRRVTRPGGTISAAVWDYGDGMEMLRLFWDAAVELDPSAERLDEKHMPLCRTGELAELFRTAGLVDVQEKALEIMLPFASFEDYWNPFLDGQGPAGSYVAGLAAEKRSALRDWLKERLVTRQHAAGGYSLRGRVHAARGTVP